MIVESDEHAQRSTEGMWIIQDVRIGTVAGRYARHFLTVQYGQIRRRNRKPKTNEESYEILETMEDIRSNWTPTIEEGDTSMSVAW
jgi:hypothetical protein